MSKTTTLRRMLTPFLRPERQAPGAAVAGPGGVARSGDHPGSKPGFAHRHRPPRRAQPMYPETTEGVPPQYKLRRPLEPARPMGAHQRLTGYVLANGGPQLTPAQRRRYDHKLNHGLAKARARS